MSHPSLRTLLVVLFCIISISAEEQATARSFAVAVPINRGVPATHLSLGPILTGEVVVLQITYENKVGRAMALEYGTRCPCLQPDKVSFEVPDGAHFSSRVLFTAPHESGSFSQNVALVPQKHEGPPIAMSLLEVSGQAFEFLQQGEGLGVEDLGKVGFAEWASAEWSVQFTVRRDPLAEKMWDHVDVGVIGDKRFEASAKADPQDSKNVWVVTVRRTAEASQTSFVGGYTLPLRFMFKQREEKVPHEEFRTIRFTGKADGIVTPTYLDLGIITAGTRIEREISLADDFVVRSVSADPPFSVAKEGQRIILRHQMDAAGVAALVGKRSGEVIILGTRGVVPVTVRLPTVWTVRD